MLAPARTTGSLAMVTREEVWHLHPYRRLEEERLIHGMASFRGSEIIAIDDADAEVLARAQIEIDAARSRLPRPRNHVLARIVVNARRVHSNILTESAIVLSSSSHALVSSTDHVESDCDALMQIASLEPSADTDYRSLPLVWKNGSAAVLLHEAAGHPAEHRRPRLEWPPWLTARDEPPFAVDDIGFPTGSVDLLGGEMPSATRCASFADVPLRRLSNVVVKQSGAPFDLPARRIEILLVAGGHYESLTDRVRVEVSAADIVEGRTVRRLRPFIIDESRRSVASSLAGASGETARYPGVVCLSEGQEIVVGSHAPLLVTHFRS